MRKIYLSILLLISGCLFHPLNASNLPGSKDDCNSLNILFVENSQIADKGDLSGELLFRLENMLDSIQKKDNAKFLLYISNGDHPTVENKDYSKALDMISKLYDEPTKPAPSNDADLNKMRVLLFSQAYTVANDISIHYFITDHYLSSLMDDGFQKMTNFFAREIAYNTNFAGKTIDVYIYFSSKVKNSRPKDLEKQFEFCSKMGLNPKVNFHFKLLK